MRKPTCVILVMIVMVGLLLFVQDAYAGTNINGAIYSNTTWTKNGSPYTLTSNIVVNSGVTLTINPGVNVNFYSFKLQVNGILNAQGASDNKIVFSGNNYASSSIEFTATSTGWTSLVNPGCIIDNAVIFSVPM